MTDNGTKVTTLGELGPVLPLGALDQQGRRSKAFEIKPWFMKQEKALGKLRARNPDASMAQYVSMVLGEMCRMVGTHQFDTLKDEAKRAVMSRMLMGDVYYMYVYLRRESISSELQIEGLRCPSCGRRHKEIQADLDSTKVLCADDVESLLWDFQLQDPFDFRGKAVESITFGPARWSAVESIPSGVGMDTGLAKNALIIGSIYGMDGDRDVVVTDTELDECLTKRDLEGITFELDEHHLGPDMSVEVPCGCGRELRAPIDWGYDNFFAGSSR